MGNSASGFMRLLPGTQVRRKLMTKTFNESS